MTAREVSRGYASMTGSFRASPPKSPASSMPFGGAPVVHSAIGSVAEDQDVTDELHRLRKKNFEDYDVIRHLFEVRKGFIRLQEFIDVDYSFGSSVRKTMKQRELRHLGHVGLLRFMKGGQDGVIAAFKFLYEWMDRVEHLKAEFKKPLPDDNNWGTGEPQYERKLAQLRRLHAYWACVTPEMLAFITRMLGDASGRFMRCLTIHLAPKLRMAYPKIFDRLSRRMIQFCNFDMSFAPGHFQQCNSLGEASVSSKQQDEEDEDDEDTFWEKLAPEDGVKPRWWQVWQSQQRQEVCFYWSGIPHMFCKKTTENINVLAKVPHTAEVWRSPTGQAILAYNWSRIKYLYWMERFFDGVAICILMDMAKEVSQQRWPYQPVIFALLIINIYGCFNALIEVFMRVRMLNPYGFWNLTPGFGTCVSLLLQSFMIFTVNWLLFSSADLGTFSLDVGTTVTTTHDPECGPENKICGTMFQTNPLVFSMMIFAHWGQLMIALLAWEPAGLTVLPAFRAMISADSLQFLMFQMLFVLMSTHAYYALPLSQDAFEIDKHEHLGRAMISFFRMFRLNILGDFDFFELEGVDPTLGGHVNLTNGNGSFISAQIDEGSDDFASVHRDLRVLCTVLVFIFCVVMMNMYIGVLGHKYDDFKTSVDLIYATTKSEWIGRCLLRLEFWTYYFPCTKCFWPRPFERYDHFEDSEDETDDDDGEVFRQLNMNTDRINMAFIKNAIPDIESCRGNWVVVGMSSRAQVKEHEDDMETVKKDVADVKKDVKALHKKMELLLDHFHVAEQ